MQKVAVEGKVQETNLDIGRLWRISAVPQRISMTAPRGLEVDNPSFKVLIQVAGEALVRQNGRQVELTTGMFTIVDGGQPFGLDMPVSYAQVLVQLPRQAVVARYPGIERRTATPSDPDHAGDALFLSYVSTLAERGTALSHSARLRSAAALIELLGVIQTSTRPAAARQLLSHALALIDIHLSDCEFTPEQLAMQLRVSRRHLDAIFSQHALTVSGVIWERRLQQAAGMLKASNTNGQRIGEICYSVGFRDPAHFARSFKKRFGASPRIWREQQRSLLPRLNDSVGAVRAQALTLLHAA